VLVPMYLTCLMVLWSYDGNCSVRECMGTSHYEFSRRL